MFFIDVQGTLIDENQRPIEGSIEFIEYLNEKEIPYVIITNNTKNLSIDFFNFLKYLGFNIAYENYIDPFVILEDVAKNKDVAIFGEDDFVKILLSMGYRQNLKNPKSLIVSVRKDYTNEDYSKMIEISLKVDDLIAMHETSIYLKDEKRYPGAGAIMHMVSFASNKSYRVVGKPSPNFFEKARKKIDAKYEDVVIISDDMIGDLLGARKLNMETVLVLSGKVKHEEEILSTLKESQKPKHICKNMKSILELLKKGSFYE